jgi:ABC-2 type transport system permease protein
MSALRRLIAVESRLYLREPVGAFFGVAFPSVLVLVLGTAMPTFTEPSPDLGGRRPIDLYLAIVFALAIATVSMVTLVATLSAYRERGVLRRLKATPVSPRSLLAAQIVVNSGALVVGAVLAFVTGRIAFDVRGPENVVGFVAAFLLGTVAMGAVALLIAAVAPTAAASSGIGTLVYFPMMFFAGVWTPGPLMPDVAQRIADFTPLGAASAAMQDAWVGEWPAPLHVAVMAAFGVGLGALAARLFRWE